MNVPALLIAAASLLVLPLVVRWFWRSAVLRREWTATSSLIFLIGMVGGLPTALSNLVSPRPETFNAFGEVRVGLTGWAAALEELITASTLVASLLFLVLRAGSHRLVVGAWTAAGIVVVAAVSDVVAGDASELGPRLLALLAALLAAGVGDRGRPAQLGAAAVCLTYALLSGLQAVVHPSDAFRECRPDKCGPAGGLYAGAFSNENTFGLTLALSAVFVWLVVRGRTRVVLLAYILASVVLTGSRTAILAAAALVLVIVLLRPRLDDPPVLPAGDVRRWLAGLLVALAAMAGLLLPFTAGPALVGDRAHFWQLAVEGISRSPLAGLGGTAWPRLYESGQIPMAGTYSPHNQWLDLLYAAGLLGCALFIALLVGVMAKAGRFAPVAAAVLLPVLVASMLERPWSFAINDGLTFTLVAALLCPTAGAGILLARRRGEPAPSPVELPSSRI